VSVPQGIGANRTDGHRHRLLRFAPPTPPWRRQAQNEGIKESMTLSREPLELRTGWLPRSPCLEQIPILPKSPATSKSRGYERFSLSNGFRSVMSATSQPTIESPTAPPAAISVVPIKHRLQAELRPVWTPTPDRVYRRGWTRPGSARSESPHESSIQTAFDR
jgi:hypothetical protein